MIGAKLVLMHAKFAKLFYSGLIFITAFILLFLSFKFHQLVYQVLWRKQTWLMMLQNSNELRASGGFMGSYALITLEKGQVTELAIEDVYDADGQWQGFIEAPTGIKEYLSGGKGLRLPDANWAADFLSAASQIKFFLESTKNKSIDGVVAINVQVLSALLKLTGPISLPDYQLILTADNADDLLQDRPQSFFPGSRQKVDILTHSKTQMLLSLNKLTWQKRIGLLQVIYNQFRQKNIMLFSTHDVLQKLFEELKIAGKLPKATKNTAIFYLLESNVGINKINQWITRKVTLEPKHDQLQTQVEFFNQAKIDKEQNNSLYVNYQRLIIPKDWQVRNVSVNNQPLAFHTNTKNPEFLLNHLQEVGWLLTVKPQEKLTVTIDINLNQTKQKKLQILKQPGLNETEYILNFGNNHQVMFILDQDKVWLIKGFLFQ